MLGICDRDKSSSAVIVVFLVIAVAISGGASTYAARQAVTGRDLFEDRSSQSGLRMILRHGATPEKHQIETMAGGVAMFDYDSDGRLDLYFANGALQPKLAKPDSSWHNRLYRNLGGWRFEDVTMKAGVPGSGFHFGVAAADYDNDGHVDIYVAGMPQSIVYRNRGDGTFEDVTIRAGVRNRRQWPVSAGWFDYDNDGKLDLFIVNYVAWNPAGEPFCGDSVNRRYRTYCHPKHYTGLANTLLRNNGDGTFTDVTDASGIGKHVGKGMGVAFADYGSDGDMDIFVANDTVPNFLFRNDGGKFTEVGAIAGVAFNDDGRALSSMGADFRDIDNDGRDDVFVTALANETFPFYRDLGNGQFIDNTYPSGIGKYTLPLSGWSNAVVDLDNDGWKDLIASNGDVQDNSEVFSSLPSRQRSIVLRNSGKGQFEGVAVGPASLHRGAAFGDLDGDGAVDAVLTRLGDTPVLLRNKSLPLQWVALRLKGRHSNRDGIGAKIRLSAGGLQQWNHMTSAVGYASSSHGPVHFGLGRATKIDSIEIRWPSGTVQQLTGADLRNINRVIEVQEP
jgi:enediyne biosynthesis protein E4